MKRAGLPIALFALALALQPALALRQGTLSPIPASSLLKKPASTGVRGGKGAPAWKPSNKPPAAKPAAPTSADDNLLREKKQSEAEAAYRQVIQKIAPTRKLDNEKLVNAYLGLAEIYAQRGSTQEALKFFELALDIAESEGVSETTREHVRRTLPELHSLIESRRDFARTGRGSAVPPNRIDFPEANTLLGTDDATQIEVALKAIWTNVNQTYKKRGPAHIHAALNLVKLYMQQQRLGEAEMLVCQIDDIYPKLSATDQAYCVKRMLDESTQLLQHQHFRQAEHLYLAVLKGAKLTDPSLQVNEKLSQIVDSLLANHRYTQAESLEKALLAADDKSDDFSVTEHRLKLAKVLRMTRRFGAAEELYKLALESQEKHGSTNSVLLPTLVQMTNLYIAMQQKEPLTQTVNKLNQVLNGFVISDSFGETWRELQDLSVALTSAGETQSGVKLLQTIINNTPKSRRYNYYDVQQAIQRTARAAAQVGDVDSAVQLYQFALKESGDDTANGTSEPYSNQLITLLFENNQNERGTAAVAEYLEKFKAGHSPIHTARSIAQTLDRFQQHKSAAAIWQRIVDSQVATTIEQKTELASNMNSCARSLIAAGDDTAAEAMLKRLIAMIASKNADYGEKLLAIFNEYKAANKFLDCRHVGDDIVHSYYLRTDDESELLGRIAAHYQTLGHPDQADAVFQQALKIAEKAYGNDSHQIRNLRNRYANILRSLNRGNEAAEIEKTFYSTAPQIRRP